MEKITGVVIYDVEVVCPGCGHNQNLNMVPHCNKFDEDELGNAVFGSVNVPAKWDGLNLEYECALCQTKFILSSLET